MSLRVQENVRSDVKEIIIWLHNIQERKIISLQPSYFVPDSLQFAGRTSQLRNLYLGF